MGLSPLAAAVPVPGTGSKISADALLHALGRGAGDPHSMRPSALSISQSTETGDVYTLAELRTLSLHAKSAGLGVHMDGARFANALSRLGATPAELSWQSGVDVLSFGTTKNGTVSADAVISFSPAASLELRARTKRAGQLAAKSRFSAAQLDAYLSDELWLRNAAHANTLASRLWDGLKGLPGVDLHPEPETNLVFCALDAPVIEQLLAEGYSFYHDRWEPGVVRFVTSFAHQTADVDGLVEAITRLTADQPEPSDWSERPELSERSERTDGPRPQRRDDTWDHCMWV